MRNLGVALLGAVVCVALVLELGAKTVTPALTDEVLNNPDMGLCYYQYSNRFWAYSLLDAPAEQPDRVPGSTVSYMRLQWCDLEPTEGDIRWDMLDGIIQNWARRGKKSAFRFVVSMPTTNACPDWVRAAGVQGVYYSHRYFPKGVTRWEPKFDDPIFLAKLETFLSKFGARYDGDPNIAFVDIGSFGLYGEGHTGNSQRLSQEETDRICKIHIDLHLKYLPRTYLVLSDDVSGSRNRDPDAKLMRYCREKGVGFRDDSIFCFPNKALHPESPFDGWAHDGWARLFAPTLPVVVEAGHYIGKDNGNWLYGRLVDCAEQYRASYFSVHGFPHEILADNAAEYAVLARRVGYRFEPRQIEYPERIRIDEPVCIRSTWVNTGTAPRTRLTRMAWSLVDEKGAVVWSCSDDAFDFRSLQPTIRGEEKPIVVTSTCRFGRTVNVPADTDGMLKHSESRGNVIPRRLQLLQPGNYTLCLSVGGRTGSPEIALPLLDGNARRYPVGKIEVVE